MQYPLIIDLQTRDLHDGRDDAKATDNAGIPTDAPRAGIDSTHAQAIRRRGLGRTGYLGLAKTRLQHVITAVAINLLRIASWQTERGLPRRAVPTSRLSNSVPREFATSVNVGSTPRSGSPG